MKDLKILILLLALFIFGCDSETTHSNGHTVDSKDFTGGRKIPTGATDFEYIDQQWMKYTLDGDRILMYCGSHNSVAITKIN